MFGHGEVVKETDGFGACADQIIRAHRDTVYPDGIVLPHQLSNDDLGPDAISMEAQDSAIVEVNETRVMSNRKNGMPDFPLTGHERRLEPSSKILVGFSGFGNVNSRSGVGHAGPRQDYSFSPVKRW